jgi:penicillin amidase
MPSRRPSWTRRLFRGLLGVVGVLVLLVVGVGIAWRQASLPRIDGEQAVSGVRQATEVLRDAYGIPHIYAQSIDDAQFALGYVHAQDRLWQMEINRRVAAGRLAEIFGRPALDTDRFLRTLGVRRTAQAMYDSYSPADRRLLDAYAAGVNAFIDGQSLRAQLSPEFLLVNAPAPEPWTPADSIAWTLMMAWDLGGNWSQELTRLRLSLRGMGSADVDQLLPPVPPDPTMVPVDYRQALRDWGIAFEPLQAQVEQLGQLALLRPNGLEGVGSNNWVIGGARTESGKPLLANDPHLGLSTPSLWYFASLSAPNLSVVGATLPGVPGVILGRNDRIAWGFTNTGSDVQDLFIEALDPSDPERYRTPDGWRRFDTHVETIRIKGEPDDTLRVRRSRHGPVLSMGGSAAATGVLPPNYAIALQWVALQPDNRTPLAAFALNQARNRGEFEAALRDIGAPHQNIVYADVDGLIGFVAPGAVPIRHDDNDVRGRFPVPGWDARYDWDSRIPYADLPQEWSPARGYRGTANEKVVADDYPFFLTGEWAPSWRAQRIASLIESAARHDMGSMNAMQRDEVSYMARAMLPRLLAVAPPGEREMRVMDRLRTWSGAMRADLPEPAIFALWWRELTRQLVDRNGLAAFGAPRTRFIELVLADQDGASHWCGQPDGVEPPCERLIAQSLVAALDAGEAALGRDPLAWRYGDMHRTRAEHRPFGRVPALDWLFSLRETVGGDAFTLNAMSAPLRPLPAAGRPADQVMQHVTHGPGMRAIYDLADPERSRFVHSSGQSGNRLSPHYQDFSAVWARGDTIPMHVAREKVEPGAVGTLRLVPAQ